VELIHDLEPIVVSDSEAQKFKMQHGDKCDIWAGEAGQWLIKFKKGACIFVPKAFKFSRTVAELLYVLVICLSIFSSQAVVRD
jgi:fatty acid synthase subunit alpha, fungi type